MQNKIRLSENNKLNDGFGRSVIAFLLRLSFLATVEAATRDRRIGGAISLRKSLAENKLHDSSELRSSSEKPTVLLNFLRTIEDLELKDKEHARGGGLRSKYLDERKAIKPLGRYQEANDALLNKNNSLSKTFHTRGDLEKKLPLTDKYQGPVRKGDGDKDQFNQTLKLQHKKRRQRNENEISDADLAAAEKGKNGPKIHVKLEASKKENPGELAEELNRMGAELPAHHKKEEATFPWWGILLVVILVLVILALIIALAVYMKKKRRKDTTTPPPKKKIKGATANIIAKRDPNEFKCLSAGYIDEIAMMDEEEESDNKLKGVHSSDFPTLKEAKKLAKKKKSSLKGAIGWD